jgi:ribose transport system substrate-binding protein
MFWNSARRKTTLYSKAVLTVLAVITISFGAFVLLHAAAGIKPYTIYLSNNFVGNDWRQQMLRTAAIVVKMRPLAGRVNLKVENVETTVQAQINSLNNIIRTHPDAILIDAGSPTALNPTIEKACHAGILVIAFDQVTTAECAYGLESDWTRAATIEAQWIARETGGKGKVLVDRGLAGAPVSAKLLSGYEEILGKYPGIRIVGYFNGDYSLGPEQAGVANLLAAHPAIDAILSQGYGAGAIKALEDAGRKVVPITGSSFNVSTVTCARTPGAACILASNPPYLSAEALKLAVEILDGKIPHQKHILVNGPFLTTDPAPSSLFGGAVMEKIEVNKNAFPNLPLGLALPFTPNWVEITAKEAAGT